MGSFGPLEIFLVFLVILLVFGAKRIPEIARGLGKGISEFKRATQEFTSEFDVSDQSQIDRQKRPSQGNRQPRSNPNYERQDEPAGQPSAAQQGDASAPQADQQARQSGQQSAQGQPSDQGAGEETSGSSEQPTRSTETQTQD